jgi:hypothetical protein
MNKHESLLTFIIDTGRNAWHQRIALYKCKCGNETVQPISAVNYGRIISCGCFKKSFIGVKTTTHGLTSTPLYPVWCNMIARCEDIKNNRYHRYGGRGVTICDEWRNDFRKFYDWALENGWRKGLEIDKDIKGTGSHYSPEMCCVVTGKQNSNKRSNNKFIEYSGQIKTVAQWAEEKLVSPFLIYKRLSRGWTPKEAIETPLITTFKNIKWQHLQS